MGGVYAYMKLTYQRYRFTLEAFNEIKKHYGRSKFFRDDVKLHVLFNPDDKDFGWFSTYKGPEIFVNYATCTRMKQVIGTLIHEYQHYLQSPAQYSIQEQRYTYENHPYEKMANKIAKRDLHLFID